ncbi:antitoxin Phd_YefM of type II toxin-antitoxin system [Kribbella sp. VKM Ac-2527]|uniref:Antitoxin Phd_YefM of type II toxin-antitoxin system n=1 Tax=Kribbella caucasensis TaxID=2512215 RepID=A0A4R6KQM5_9ACTN|nr:type II toxin-antitoxin system Phd/YefM family antitoxin [Kribbella sp. VKM Ac-2527]TDO52680.1 antitoxin Phd_YefM of type II toxin-antitoxin system [Kribbella sp. VKM Ac-2527]
MSESYSLADGPAELEALVARAADAHERVDLTEDDTTVAVIISLTDYQELQDAVDQADIAEAEAVKAADGPWIPHEEVVAMLERDDSEQV